MTLGRILRIESELLRSPRDRRKARLLMHAFFAMFTAVIAFSPAPNPKAPRPADVLLLSTGLWIAASVQIEYSLRFRANFEVQLLPGAVRVKKWGRDELLIEPEVVGGRVAWNQIQLRAGDRSASIGLGWFNSRQDRAAVIEHCSQFLSAEQQAAYGHEWARQYYKLLTARKPPKPPTTRALLRTIGITYGACLLFLVICFEPLIANGITKFEAGVPFRQTYVALTLVVALLTCLLTVGQWLEQRKTPKVRPL
jgi:hypothetical protein